MSEFSSPNLLKLVRIGPYQYWVWDTVTEQYVECNSWPKRLANRIVGQRKRCFKGFRIKRGRLEIPKL